MTSTGNQEAQPMRSTRMNQMSRRTITAIAAGMLAAPALLVANVPAALGSGLAAEYKPSGKDIEGASSVDEAPEVTTGRYLDKIPRDSTIYYKVKRSAKGTVVHAGLYAENDPSGDQFDDLVVKTFVANPDDTDDGLADCSSSSIDKRWLEGQKQPYSYGATSTWTSDAEASCARADEVIVGVTNTGSADANLPMQLAIYEEPALADPAGRDLTPAENAPTWEDLEAGDAKDGQTPADGLVDAPVLDDGTYSFEITPGQTQFVAVELDWNQSLQAMLETKVSDELLGDIGDPGQLAVDVINPVFDDPRVELSSVPSGWVSGSDLSTASAVGTFRTGALTYPVNYLNRSVGDSRGAAFPGRNFVRIRLSGADGSNAKLKYSLTVKRNGKAGEGAPEYAESGGAKAPSADSDVESGSGFAVLPLVLALIGLAAIAAAAVFVKRARSPQG